MSSEVIMDSNVIDGLSVWMLKLSGFWGVINHYRSTGKRSWFFKLQSIITILFNAFYMFCQYIVYLFIEVDVQKITFINIHSLPCHQIMVRFMVMWFRLDSICRLYDLVRKDFLSTVPDYKREGIRKIYKEISRKANRTCIASILSDVSIIILWIAIPGFSVEYIAHHTGNMDDVKGGRKKIMGGWYPFPITESPYFEVFFYYEVLFQIWNATLMAIYACLFYLPLVSLQAQFAALGNHLSILTIENDNFDRNKFNRELYAIVQDHLKLIKYANELIEIYNPLVTMILGVGIFILTIAVFQFLFGSTGDPISMIKFTQILAYQGIESSDLQYAFYSSDWYKADNKYRRSGQMLMLQANRNLTLTAIRMYPVNEETVMSIFQFTYTVAALMSKTSD